MKDLSSFLVPLELIIRSKLIPALTCRPPPSDLERNLLALPARLGGMAIPDPSAASNAYISSLKITQPIVNAILTHDFRYSEQMIAQQLEAKKDVRKENQILAKNTAAQLGNSLPVSLRRPMEMAQERGASSWLTSLPIEEFNFTLHKGAFHDAIAIRYGWSPSRMPKHCDCGSKFSLEHSFSCPKGGFPSIRHNEIRDLTANLLWKFVMMFVSSLVCNHSQERS